MIEQKEHLKRHDYFLYLEGISQQVRAAITLALDLLEVAQEIPDQDHRDRLTRIITYSECWRRHKHLDEALEQLVELQKRLDSEMMLGFQMAKALKPAIVLAQKGEQLLEFEDTNPPGPAH